MSKMLAKFIAFLVTNRLHTMDLTCRECTMVSSRPVRLKKYKLHCSKLQLAKSALFSQLNFSLLKF